MSPSTFRLIVLISFAHALVHSFELALPSVEQMICEDFDVEKSETGVLGTVWRLPFGLGALLAGWLADRFGSKKMLIVYLVGCSGTAFLTWYSTSIAMLFGVMFAMGCFASLYHPAGLSLISRETTPETRGAALGWHGIFGSLGIAGAPFMAYLFFSTDQFTWRDYYLVLMGPALVIAVLLIISLFRNGDSSSTSSPRGSVNEPDVRNDSENDSPTLDKVRESIPWKRFGILVMTGALSGIVYAAFMQFLPRYLSDTGLKPEGWTDESFRNALAALVLVCGAVGQAVAGRLAKPGRLEKLLVFVMFANVPPLIGMAFASGIWQLVAAGILAFIHFMNQPIYNSLIAQVIPESRRSTGYGFSNMICFGLGALGPLIAGSVNENAIVYSVLAGFALAAGVVSLAFARAELNHDGVKQ
jgi:MFS transporter, FSR family, fosmidomycin resistance protein